MDDDRSGFAVKTVDNGSFVRVIEMIDRVLFVGTRP